MSLNYEFLDKMYPEWKSQTNPLLYIVIIIFLLIVILSIIPYIYIQIMKQKKKYWLNEWKKMKKEEKLKERGVEG